MFGYDVTLDFIRTGPGETAERRALAPGLMYILQVPLELLDSFKVSIAIVTSRLHPAPRADTFAVAPRALSNYMPSSFMGSSLGYR